MAIILKYKAYCYYCNNLCDKGNGYLHRVKGQWFAHCFDCYKEKKLKEEKLRKEKSK